MAIDKTLINQLRLLSESLDANAKLDTKLTAVIALLDLYSRDKATNVQILKALKVLTNAQDDSIGSISGALIAYIDMFGVLDKKSELILNEELIKQFKFPTFKNDSVSVVKKVKAIANKVKQVYRLNVFANANLGVTNEARRRGEKVIWRARTQADEMCQTLNGKIMTPDQFDEFFPVHINCMCTAELIPQTANYQEYITA